MTSLGEIIKAVYEASEAGYVFDEEDRSFLAELVRKLDRTERKILANVLESLGINIGKDPIDEWVELANTWDRTQGRDIKVIRLEMLYDLENPMEDYPFSLEEDETLAGMLYKGDHRYDTLLSYFNPEMAANVYLAHYDGSIKSVEAFYRLMKVFRLGFLSEVLSFIFDQLNKRIIDFLMLMKLNALDTLGEDRCKELGTWIFRSWYRNYINRLHSPSFLRTNDVLHLVYVLGFYPQKIENLTYALKVAKELRPAEIRENVIEDLLRSYCIFRVIWMKYKDIEVFSISPERMAKIDYSHSLPLYPNVVGEERKRLYLEFHRYVERLEEEYSNA